MKKRQQEHEWNYGSWVEFWIHYYTELIKSLEKFTDEPYKIDQSYIDEILDN